MMTGLWRRELLLNKNKPTQMSGVSFGGPLGPYFELFQAPFKSYYHFT